MHRHDIKRIFRRLVAFSWYFSISFSHEIGLKASFPKKMKTISLMLLCVYTINVMTLNRNRVTYLQITELHCIVGIPSRLWSKVKRP